MDSARRVGIRSEGRDPSTMLPRATRPATSLRVTEKKAGTKRLVPALSWLVARINSLKEQPHFVRRTAEGGCPYTTAYAVLLGRTVRSRTWVKMLDICIPFSCETKGRISAMN
jgi:hypothetical protein